MDYRTVEKPSFTVVGKPLRVSTINGENMRQIPQFWQECLRDGSHDHLLALAAKGVMPGDATLGISTDFAADKEAFTYLIAVEGCAGAVPSGLVEKTIPAATWAVFEVCGPIPDALQAVWGRISSEFFPSHPFSHEDGSCLEVYPSGDPTQPDYRSEVWVPITPASATTH